MHCRPELRDEKHNCGFAVCGRSCPDTGNPGSGVGGGGQSTDVDRCQAEDSKNKCKKAGGCRWTKIKRGKCAGGVCLLADAPEKKIKACVPVICSELTKENKCKKLKDDCNW